MGNLLIRSFSFTGAVGGGREYNHLQATVPQRKHKRRGEAFFRKKGKTFKEERTVDLEGNPRKARDAHGERRKL